MHRVSLRHSVLSIMAYSDSSRRGARGFVIMHTNEVSQKSNLPAMTTGESDAGASMKRGYELSCRGELSSTTA